MLRLATALSLCAGLAAAQEITIEQLDGLEDGITLRQAPIFEDVIEEVKAIRGTGAVLRGLDKLTGDVADVELQSGFSVRFATLRIDLAECRHPEDNIAGEAFAYLAIHDGEAATETFFEGWMVASSPALNAMDHARYDIWVLRCTTDAASTSDAPASE
ncbi:DUF2155 domain-containing protein [Cognatishimia sp. SS12]|uniref:DUF2155 domain-containing protein n=1 Tax=Cognatishimia sp. SS12 TaxID=2979465 RepID=UPI00232DD1E5|nr:DUF2155 domain-containing protein [Cognatishimia sp. SS12]MDC0736884.1 DUF2155 domain-containing protein [Cognatishimia sp. SS12]